MSAHIHCDICEISAEWVFKSLEGWQSVSPSVSMVAFAAKSPEKHICPRCWQFLEDNHARLMLQHGRVANT